MSSRGFSVVPVSFMGFGGVLRDFSGIAGMFYGVLGTFQGFRSFIRFRKIAGAFQRLQILSTFTFRVASAVIALTSTLSLRTSSARLL